MISYLSVIVVLCCFSCACSFCCLKQMKDLISDLLTIIDLMTEESDG